MRTITLGGHKYPINCSVMVDAQVEKRFSEAVAKAEEEANAEADEKDLNEAKRKRLIDRRKVSAAKKYLSDAENSLWQFAIMINDAVRFEAVMNNRDISKDVFGYPMTAEMVGMIATVDDLNRADTIEAVAAEFAACRGGDEKNLDAGELMKAARKAISSM